MRPLILLVTTGEGAGIGPDLTAALSKEYFPGLIESGVLPVVLSDRARMLQALEAVEVSEEAIVPMTPPFHLPEIPRGMPALPLFDVRALRPIRPGVLDPLNAPYVLQQLKMSVTLIQRGLADALCTFPIHKGLLSEASPQGRPFLGHTEFLQEATGSKEVIMAFGTPACRIALATRHLPLSQVPARLTQPLLVSLGTTLASAFPHSKQLYLGLNPHAGEGGALGREEADVLAPALETLRGLGVEALGPVAADTFFLELPRLGAETIVVGMYHDQVLPWMKSHFFDEAVNFTLGLPFLRSSPDHGTALGLAAAISRGEKGALRVKSAKAAVEFLVAQGGRIGHLRRDSEPVSWKS